MPFQYCHTQPLKLYFSAMEMETLATRDPYLVKSVVHSSQLLRAFRSAGEVLP